MSEVTNDADRSRSPRRKDDDEEASNKDSRGSSTPRSEGKTCFIPIPDYTQIDPTTWKFKQLGSMVAGKTQQKYYIITDSNDQTPTFCFYQKNEVCQVKWELKPYGDEKPAFMSGGAPTKAVERLNLSMTCVGGQVDWLCGTDIVAKKAIQTNSLEWLGKQLSEQDVDLCFSSAVVTDDKGINPPYLRAKIALAGIDKYLTKIHFVDANDFKEIGYGWDFVESKLGDKKWKGYKVRCVLAPKLWITGSKKFGLNYQITELAVQETRQFQHSSPFDHDNSFEALQATAL